MRLRPGPVVEAMATVALSFVFIFVWFALFPLKALPQIATYSILLFLFPIFSVQLIGGLFIKSQPATRRFLVLGGLAALTTIGFLVFFSRFNANIVNNGALTTGQMFQIGAVVVFVSVLLSLAITEFFIVADGKSKLSGSQYSQNPSVPSKSKRKKK